MLRHRKPRFTDDLGKGLTMGRTINMNENRELANTELNVVGGGAGFGVVTDRRIALTAQLSEIYKRNNPPSFGPIHLLG